MALPRSDLLDSAVDTDRQGKWVVLDRESREDVDLGCKVEGFHSLSHPAGVEAARWLREDAFDNDPLTRTRVLVSDERVEGFIATCFGSVALTGGGRKRLSVPRRLQRQQVPAFILCWVARHRDSLVPGAQLMLTALGLAREAKRNSGLAVFALDPYDERVAKMWQGQPWHFRKARAQDGRPPRLYLPL